MFNSPYRSTILFLSLTAFFLYLQLFRFPATPILFEGDHAVHLSNAWRLFQGEVAFRDFFLFTFPGTEFFYLVFFKLFGVKLWILNAAIFCLLLSLSAVGLFFSRQLLSGWAVYLPVSIFIIIGFRPLGIDGSHRFFSVLAVLLAVAVLFSQRTSSRLFLAGTFCGLASCFTQPRGLVGMTAIIFFLAVEKFYTKQNLSAFIRSIIWVVLPFALIIGFISIYFIITAGFETFYFATFVFPVKHYPADVWNNPRAFLRDVPGFRETPLSLYLRQAVPVLFNYFLIPWVYLLFFVVLWFKRQTISDEKKLQLIFINLAGLFLAIGVFSSPSSARFYQISLPGLISLVWIIQYLFHLPKIILSFLIISGLLGLSYIVQRQTIPVYSLDTPSGSAVSLSAESLSRYKWVADHTQPNDYLYEAHHPSLYMIFQLKNPTPLPLIRPNNYTSVEQVDDVIKGLKQNPPRYIIWNGIWETYNSNQSPDFHLPPLADFVHTNYHRVEKLNNFSDVNNKVEYEIEIWEKNEPD
ncbi:MAG: hypothetical protein ACR2MG_06165 [Pyrinomonadaceae bacterium]